MIREITPADRERYLEMAHDFYQTSAVLHPIPDSYIEKTFAECVENGIYGKIYILEYDGQIAGYGLIGKTFSQEAGGYVYWLDELYILEQYRSKGLGSEFFAYMEANKEPGVKRFRLEVEADNKRAAALYERLGYQDMPYIQKIREF